MPPLIRLLAYIEPTDEAGWPVPLPSTHGVLNHFRSVSLSDDCANITYTRIPYGYLCVELSDLTQQIKEKKLVSEDGILFHLASYPTVATLLQDLYSNYLSEVLPSNSYGQSWVLAAKLGPIHQVMLPWQGLETPYCRSSSIFTPWAQHQHLKPYAEEHSTHWAIAAPTNLSLIGLAVRDQRIAQAIESYPRVLRHLERYGVLQPIPVPSVQLDSGFMTYVYDVEPRHLENIQPNAVYVQQNVPPSSYEALLRAYIDE